MRKAIASVLCLTLAALNLAACSSNTNDTAPADIVGSLIATSSETSNTTAESTTETTKETEARGHFEFKPVVVASIFRKIMGEDMYTAYGNYIEAVRSGKDSFAVKDQETYDWMMGQFPCVCYPVVEVSTESNYAGAVKDGIGTFQYKIPKEEFAVKNAEFEKLVTDMLNENLRDDYSDFEKVLALYIYFANNYTYDYESYEAMKDHVVDDLSAYRFLTTGHGICSECAPAFSYLLLQAGVDATCVGGYDHEWSYVTINGKNYHVDPTFAMESGVNLSYLMETDQRREDDDGFKKKDNIVGNHYGDYKGTEFNADDTFFEPLKGGYLESWDPEKNIIIYRDDDGNMHEFDYSPFG